MAGRRKRLRFRADAGRGPRISLEWLGFRDGGASAALDTSAIFELIPPAAESAVIETDLTVLRVVGQLCFKNQGTVTTPTTIGAMLFKGNVGGDQTIDDGINPLTTDPDNFDHSGIMWWQTWPSIPYSHGVTGEYDVGSVVMPIDIKVKRKLDKKDTLIMRVDAGTTGRAVCSCNLRTLIRIY